MFDGIFTNNPLLEKTILVIVVFACISLFFVLVSVLFKKKLIKLHVLGNSFELHPDNPSGTSARVEGKHEDLIAVYNMTNNTANMVSLLKTKQLLFDQMSYLEDKAIIIRETLISAYRRCQASSLTGDDNAASYKDMSNKEYQFFNSLVTLMIEDQKKTCKHIFIKNNFSNLVEKEFQDYLDDKITLLLTKARLFVRELYPSEKMGITFEQIEQEVFDKTADTLTKNYEQVFRKAAQIYRKKHEEADTLAKDLRTYIKQAYGADVSASYLIIDRTTNAGQL